MDCISMENMFKIIKKYDIEIDREINGDCFCTICHNIMIDACNGPCGCRYCRKCIAEYLRNESRECPGQTGDCKSHPIDINTDICKDQPINNKISRLIVLCPNLYCKSKLELRSIENHLRICEKRSNSCPFTNIGCVEEKLRFDKVDEHLASDVRSHSQLLMDWITILMNDMELIKKDLDRLTLENQNLVAENVKQSEIIQEMKQIWTIKNGEQDRIISEMKQKQENQENLQQDYDLRLDKLSMENRSIKESVLETRFIEFVWIIDEWSVKLKQAQNGINEIIYSDEFFSHRNGYKMQLQLYPNGDPGYKESQGRYLSLYFCIKKGPFDNILQWPFKYDVKFELINQSTGLPHKTLIVRYYKNSKALLKPICEKNTGRGFHYYIQISEILNNPTLTQDDQLSIKCSVQI